MTPPRWHVSFRSGDFHGDDRRARKGKRPAAPDVPADGEGQHECRRDPAWLCAGYRLEQRDGGTFARLPGLTYRAYCEACRGKLITALGELPAAYARLLEATGDKPVSGGTSRAAFGPRMEYRADVDALAGELAASLAAWSARVRAVARLAAPQHAHGSAERVSDDAGTLEHHPDALLALEASWMSRTHPLKPGRHGRPAVIGEDLEESIGGLEIVRLGVDYVTVMAQRDGADAGNEILRLHYRARQVLGETSPPRESIDGVPCRECESMSLERAEPPSDPSMPAGRSRCADCGDVMDDAEFEAWAKRYEAWARGAGVLTCRRCELGRHADCTWLSCSCKGSGHVAA